MPTQRQKMTPKEFEYSAFTTVSNNWDTGHQNFVGAAINNVRSGRCNRRRWYVYYVPFLKDPSLTPTTYRRDSGYMSRKPI